MKGCATPNGIELRRNTRKPNRRRAKRAEVKAAGVVACSELFGALTNFVVTRSAGDAAAEHGAWPPKLMAVAMPPSELRTLLQLPPVLPDATPQFVRPKLTHLSPYPPHGELWPRHGTSEPQGRLDYKPAKPTAVPDRALSELTGLGPAISAVTAGRTAGATRLRLTAATPGLKTQILPAARGAPALPVKAKLLPTSSPGRTLCPVPLADSGPRAEPAAGGQRRLQVTQRVCAPPLPLR